MFAIGIEFLTGTAVMTATVSRDKAEWPPHPARVFMALVAAHYETRPLPADSVETQAAWKDEQAALLWLESQGSPALSCGPVVERDVVKVYVPVNDVGVPAKPDSVKSTEMRPALGVMPAFRSRQERTFPAVHVGLDNPGRFIYLIWESSAPSAGIKEALCMLATKVIRVGHSSSLVQLWVAENRDVPAPTLVPQRSGSRLYSASNLRTFAPGFLAELDERFNAADIETYFDLAEQIAFGKGNAKETAKANYRERFGEEWNRTSAPPVRRRPSSGLAQNYVKAVESARPFANSVFDPELLILTKQDGPVLGLEATNAIIEALRGTLLTGSENAPEWFTGHRAPGEPSTTPHLALMPLSYVGSDHSDGHLLGLALAFPRAIPAAVRAAQLSRIFYDSRGLERGITLKLGSLGEWTLRREDRAVPPLALQTTTWTEPSSVWATVTPIVLDRHPKHDPTSAKASERQAWRDEVATSVAESCRRIGIQASIIAIDIDKTSWHRGAPRSRPGPNGFPWFSTKAGDAPRQQIHALLQFDCEVQGPVLLGSGRFRGYGVCKPLGFPSK
jgi:CRISPR-associated protein Csb2